MFGKEMIKVQKKYGYLYFKEEIEGKFGVVGDRRCLEEMIGRISFIFNRNWVV